jgi:hypothetical protein
MKKIQKYEKGVQRYKKTPKSYENKFEGMKKVFPRKMVCFHIFRGQFYNNGYEKN